MYLRALLLQLGSMLLLQLRNLLFGGDQGSLCLLPPALLPISALGCKLHTGLSVMAPTQSQLYNKDKLLGAHLFLLFESFEKTSILGILQHDLWGDRHGRCGVQLALLQAASELVCISQQLRH